MKKPHLWMCVVLFTGLSGTCFATQSVTQGAIQIQGRIVEPMCMAGEPVSAKGKTTISLANCPEQARTRAMSVNRIDAGATALADSALKVRLIADSGEQGSDYQQRYLLIDVAGKPVNSGSYVITLTPP